MSYFARFRITSKQIYLFIKNNQIELYFASNFHCSVTMCMYIPLYSYVVQRYIFDWFLQIKTIFSMEQEVVVS